MYYEIFEELRFAVDNHQDISNLELINKSILDSFFDFRSQINPIYSATDDQKRLVGQSYPYLYYQKLISGIAKSIFIGFNPFIWEGPMFLENGRLRVPKSTLRFNGQHPLIYFTDDEFSYEHSSIKRWEDEVLENSHLVNPRLNIEITREGFRAHLNRILEICYSMRSSSQKRRTNWSVFLHDLLILQKTFSRQELLDLGFSLENDSKVVTVRDPNFPAQQYLEFKHLERIGAINTIDWKFSELTGPAIERYSQFNSQILGRVPLNNFYINELMFIGKEEYTFNQYRDYFLYPWTKAKDVYITYIEDGSFQIKQAPMQEFESTINLTKYALVLGFHEMREGQKVHFSSEPRMLKG